METIRGKQRAELGVDGFSRKLADYSHVALDLGTGDGRYVCQLAAQHPDWFVIGLDACRENLRQASRTGLPNVLFVIAAAEALPSHLYGQVSQFTINFPWGSLLDALLQRDAAVMHGLASLPRACASVEVRLNGEALAEAGRTLAAGTEQVCESLSGSGWRVQAPRVLEAPALRSFPSTWARRLAHGRDPRAMLISASLGHQAQ